MNIPTIFTKQTTNMNLDELTEYVTSKPELFQREIELIHFVTDQLNELRADVARINSTYSS